MKKTWLIAIIISCLFIDCSGQRYIEQQQPTSAKQEQDEGMSEEKKSLSNNEWLFLKFEHGDSSIGISMLRATIAFDESQNRVSGFSGCNRFSGSFNIKEQFNSGSLNFSQLVSTKMACPNLQLEQKLQHKLSTITKFEIRNKTLLLFKESQLVFTLRENKKK